MFFKCLNPRRALPPIRKNGFRVICHIINVFCLSSLSLIFRFLSVQFWVMEPVLKGEFSPVSTFYCHSNPMITDSGN